MKGMTELINGTFIEDLSIILSCRVDAEKGNHKTFFEIDKEFEIMMSRCEKLEK